MEEGLLELFECIKQNFFSLPLNDFTEKASRERESINIWPAVANTPLAGEWGAYHETTSAVLNKGYPLSYRENAYKQKTEIYTR